MPPTFPRATGSRVPRRLLLLLATTVALGACGDADDGSNAGADTTTPVGVERPLVVTTTTILGDVTEHVVGDLADVEVILPAGTDPHDFEPSAQQAAALRDADVIIANGLELEEGLDATLEQAEADGVPLFAVAPEVAPIPWGGDDDHGHEEDDPDHDDHAQDPHVWMDPDRMATAATLIADEVALHTELDAGELEHRAAAYGEELHQLDEALDASFEQIPPEDRTLVTNHDAFGYLADRYGFEVIGTVIPAGTTLAEPSAAALTELAELIEDEGVPAIFAETVSSTDLAETLSAETGSDVSIVELYSDSLGEPGSPGETYVAMMETNAERIVDALTS